MGHRLASRRISPISEELSSDQWDQQDCRKSYYEPKSREHTKYNLEFEEALALRLAESMDAMRLSANSPGAKSFAGTRIRQDFEFHQRKPTPALRTSLLPTSDEVYSRHSPGSRNSASHSFNDFKDPSSRKIPQVRLNVGRDVPSRDGQYPISYQNNYDNYVGYDKYYDYDVDDDEDEPLSSCIDRPSNHRGSREFYAREHFYPNHPDDHYRDSEERVLSRSEDDKISKVSKRQNVDRLRVKIPASNLENSKSPYSSRSEYEQASATVVFRAEISPLPRNESGSRIRETSYQGEDLRVVRITTSAPSKATKENMPIPPKNRQLPGPTRISKNSPLSTNGVPKSTQRTPVPLQPAASQKTAAYSSPKEQQWFKPRSADWFVERAAKPASTVL